MATPVAMAQPKVAEETTPNGRLEAPKSVGKSPAINAYLIFTNFVSAILWTVVLGRTLSVLWIRGLGSFALVYHVVGEWTKWTQTLAIIEVLHAAFGIIRASPFTTFIQVLSRLNLVWGAVHYFPPIATNSYAYPTMLIAWSLAEIIRYTFFALSLSGYEPASLKWLRYSAFIVLYPLGISSELILLFRAGQLASLIDHKVALVLIGGLMASYIPLGPMLVLHMVKQRRKIFGTPRTKKAE